MMCGHGKHPTNCGYPKCLTSDGPFEVVTLRKRVIELDKQLVSVKKDLDVMSKRALTHFDNRATM